MGQFRLFTLTRSTPSRVSVVAQNRGYGYGANGNMTNDGQVVCGGNAGNTRTQVSSLQFQGSCCSTCDANGNVVLLTDTNGALASSLDYARFGAVLTRSGAYTPRFQFSSKEWDAGAGLNYYGYRCYGSSFGRWVNRDPIYELNSLRAHMRPSHAGVVVGPEALYVFVANAPTLAFDAVGLKLTWIKCGGKCYPQFGYGGQSCCGDEEMGVIYRQQDQCCYSKDPPTIGHWDSRANCEYDGDIRVCVGDCLSGPPEGPPWFQWLQLAGCFAWCVMPVCCL